MNEETDVLLIGAHPDDAELTCAGSIIKLTREGKKVVVVDCTRGELGSRGTPEIREKEARRATEILGVRNRLNLGMQDGNIEVSKENILKIIEVIRRFRPNIIITHPHFERHPDHEAVNALVRNALFKAGLVKIETRYEGEIQKVYRTKKVFYFLQSYEFPNGRPSFYVDVSDVYEEKIRAVTAFSSQVYVPGMYEKEPPTWLSSELFMKQFIARDSYFGRLIGAEYAEAFYSVESLGVSSISKLL